MSVTDPQKTNPPVETELGRTTLKLASQRSVSGDEEA